MKKQEKVKGEFKKKEEKIKEEEKEKKEKEEEKEKNKKGKDEKKEKEEEKKVKAEEEKVEIIREIPPSETVIPVLKKTEKLEKTLEETPIPVEKKEKEKKYEIEPVVYEKEAVGKKYFKEGLAEEVREINPERIITLLPKRFAPKQARIPLKEEKIEFKPEIREEMIHAMPATNHEIKYKERKDDFEEELDWHKRERKIKKYKERY